MVLIALLVGCGSPEAAVPRAATVPAAPIVAPAAAATAEPMPGPTTQRTSKGRIVALGDLHGDSDATVKALQMAGIVGADGHWSGGTATFVQTGDEVDRGPDSKGVMALIRRLQTEAPAAGGEVIAVLGNHEVMNVQGDWRYVSPEDLAEYGGVDGRMAAFGRSGEDGAWLGKLDTVVVVDKTVFVHGGVRASFAIQGADALSKAVRDAMFVPKSTAAVLGDQGPLWFRGYVKDAAPTACDELDKALTALGAVRMVVGHTVQEDGRITPRCGGKIVAIDTGISAHYGTHLSAYEQIGGDARAIYPTATVDLIDPS